LYELYRETHVKLLRARMLSGHVQGRLLAMLSKMIRPQHILELGTFTGYSALCLAEGLADGGLLTTIEKNPELESFIRNYVEKAGMNHKIKLLIGDVRKLVPQLKPVFDLVFIDADKKQYLDYYQLVKPLVITGGYIIADNVLWDGKVPDMAIHDRDTEKIRAFNDRVHADPDVENLMLPLRDGLMVIRKLS
jgi:predicted O-methyltransferase YrrM